MAFYCWSGIYNRKGRSRIAFFLWIDKKKKLCYDTPRAKKGQNFFHKFFENCVFSKALFWFLPVENGTKPVSFQQKVLKLWKNPALSKADEYSLENLKKVAKKVKKSVDKWIWFWYYVKALERAAPKNRLMTGREKHFVN